MAIGLVRPPAGELLHFSEDRSITVFTPHVAATARESQPYVWAVDFDQAPSYWFPRDCPRVLTWASSSTTTLDRERFLGASLRVGCRARPRLVDMQRDGIDQVHGVTARNKPGRVLARPSADVQHDRWRRRQVPQEQLFGPAAFELAFLSLEPLVLLPSRVIRQNFAGRLRAIVQIHSRAQSSTTISEAPSPSLPRTVDQRVNSLNSSNAGSNRGLARRNARRRVGLPSDAESSEC